MWRRLIRRLIDRRVQETPVRNPYQELMNKIVPVTRREKPKPKYKETIAFSTAFRVATENPVGAGAIPAHILNDADELILYADQVLQQGAFELARTLFKRAIDLQPGRVDAHAALGVVYHALGETDKAIYWLRSAVELNPDDLEGYSYLLELYQELE